MIINFILDKLKKKQNFFDNISMGEIKPLTIKELIL